MFVNGESKGFGEQSHRFLFTWKEVLFQPGAIKAVGYDVAGRKLCDTAKQTAGVDIFIAAEGSSIYAEAGTVQMSERSGQY